MVPTQFTFTKPFLLGLASFTIVSLLTSPLKAQSSGHSGEGITLRPTATNLHEEIFSADVASIGLRELGYNIDELEQLDYAIQLLSIANSELDFTGVHAENYHDDFYYANGGPEILQRIGHLYDLNQGYAIDKATAEEYGITNLDQLRDPELAQLFDTDGNGKANLAGCDAGWSCSSVVAHHIKAYDLEDTVEQDSGSYSVLIADTITRYQQGESILYYYYTPLWLLDVLKIGEDVVTLPVPFTDLPGEMDDISEEDTTYEGLNTGFIVAPIRYLMNRSVAENNPAAVKFLEQVRIPTSDINAVSRRVNDGENDREDVWQMAEEWVEANREDFDQWLAAAREEEN